MIARHLFILVISFQSLWLFSQWQQVNGPYGQDIRCIASEANIIVIGSISNGVFVSNDLGITWVEKNNGLTNKRINSIAIKGSNIYAGTLSNGIFKSSDGGDNWVKLDLGQNIEGVNSILIDGNQIYAGTNGKGILFSNNNGSNWNSLNNGLNNLNVNSIIKRNSSLFAGTWGGVFLSTNNGASWNAMNSGLTVSGVKALTYRGSNLYAAGVNDGGIFYSQNNGVTWAPINNGLFNKFVLSLSADLNNIYAGTNDGVYLLKSNEFQWERKSSGHTGTHVNSIIIKGNLIITGSDGGINISDNKGENWAASNIGIADTYVNSLSSEGDKIFAGSYDGRVYIITNDGNSCKEINIEKNQNNNIDPPDIEAIESDGNNIYAAGIGGIFLSEDTGINWRKLNIPAWLGIPILKLKGTNIYYAGYGVGGLYFSPDKGVTWKDVRPYPTSTAVTALELDGNKIYAGGSGSLYVSDDTFSNWDTLTGPVLRNYNIISLLIDSENIYAGTSTFGNGVFISRDKGLNWFGSKLGLSNLCSIKDFEIFENRIFIATECNGVFYSNNKGVNWIPINEGLKDLGVTNLEISGNYLIAGTQQNGVWKRLLSDFTVDVDLVEQSDDILIFPNPSSNFIEISSTNLSQLEIFNINGQLLKIIQSSDNLRKIFDISDIPNGINFIKVLKNNKIVFKKLIKI